MKGRAALEWWLYNPCFLAFNVSWQNRGTAGLHVHLQPERERGSRRAGCRLPENLPAWARLTGSRCFFWEIIQRSLAHGLRIQEGSHASDATRAFICRAQAERSSPQWKNSLHLDGPPPQKYPTTCWRTRCRRSAPRKRHVAYELCSGFLNWVGMLQEGLRQVNCLDGFSGHWAVMILILMHDDVFNKLLTDYFEHIEYVELNWA